MDERLIYAILVKTVLLGRCPYVTFLKKIAFLVMSYQDPESYVKLTVINQKWSLKIFLNNKYL